MTRPWLRLALLALAAGTATVAAANVDASPTRILDATYSCRVQGKQLGNSFDHFVDLDIGVRLPPLDGLDRPAHVSVTTEQKYSGQFLVPQVYWEHVRDTLKVDHSNCRRSRRPAALTHAGLGAKQTATKNKLGDFLERCFTKKRVLVRYRITMSNGTPREAVIAIQNDYNNSRPIAFFHWAPRRITGYLNKNCGYNPPHLGP